MDKTVFIYALNCPITGRTRYVGKSKDPAERFRGHLLDKARNHRTNWIMSLKAIGQEPLLEILDEVLATEWPQWEVAWIEFFREAGFVLVNGTPGGDGSSFSHHTPEACAEMSRTRKGKKPSSETRIRMSEAHKRRWQKLSEEYRAIVSSKISAAHQNRSAEVRANMSAGQCGRYHSDETCAKMSVAHLGKKLSPKHCASISVATAGNKNPFFGKQHSAESLVKMSTAKKLMWAKRKGLTLL